MLFLDPWCQECPPGQSVLITPVMDLRISSACLGELVDESEESGRSQLQIYYPYSSDKLDTYEMVTNLCALHIGGQETAAFEFFVPAGTQCRLLASGDSTIHVNGSYVDQIIDKVKDGVASKKRSSEYGPDEPGSPGPSTAPKKSKKAKISSTPAIASGSTSGQVKIPEILKDKPPTADATTVKKGHMVTIAFTVRSDDGRLKTLENGMITVRLGSAEVPSGVEAVTLGMKLGGKRRIRCQEYAGFGNRQDAQYPVLVDYMVQQIDEEVLQKDSKGKGKAPASRK